MNIQAAQSNSVQQFSALNAFRTNKNVTKPETEQKQDETLSGTQTTTAKNILDKVDVADIRKFAESVGEYNITDEDIKYGMIYGRSVIAEWLC